MIKKLCLIVMTTICLNFFTQITTLAYNEEIILNINEKKPKLTKEQKKILIEKKQELKTKYLKDWKSKTDEEKKAALKAYKNEMDEFCKKEFGIPYKSFKEKYKDYFNYKPR